MLYIIATPIGNLDDISKRALEALKSVDLILAEDTRHTRKLLSHYDISTKLESFHGDSSPQKVEKILEFITKDTTIALVTDAGTPAISDPGSYLIEEIHKAQLNVSIIPIPGPSAVAAALSVSGFPADSYSFWGYPPRKNKKREDFFKNIIDTPHTQVFFSTPHHIERDLDLLKNAGVNDRLLFIGREMTKKFESYYRGDIDTVRKQMKKDKQKGEYTIVISKKS